MAYNKKTQPLPHTRDEIGQVCGLCKRLIREETYDHDMTPELCCSEFCASIREKDLAEFREAVPGTFCVYPCPGCGVAMEDEWEDDPTKGRCSDCAEAARTKARVVALRKCRDIFEESAYVGPMWTQLRAELDAAIDGTEL